MEIPFKSYSPFQCTEKNKNVNLMMKQGVSLKTSANVKQVN
jgi:hypothetical protein